MAHFMIPEHVFTGSGSIREALPFIKNCGKKALLVTGPHVVRTEQFAQVTKFFCEEGLEFVVFSGVTGEPTAEMVAAGTELFRKKHCDYVIGFGGGSPMDTAKAISAMAAVSCSIEDFAGQEIEKTAGAIVAIPTTAGTGSEATEFTIITDTQKGVKMLLKGDCMIPDIAVVDEDFGISAPRSVTVSTGLDALTHAVEAYTSKKASDLTDTLALSAVKRIMKYLPAAYRDGSNREARRQMSLAALEAGICINNSSVTLIHGLSRPIGALFHVPHGISNAMLLKAGLAFALPGAQERFANIARATGAADNRCDSRIAAERFLREVEKLCTICAVPSLKQYGVPEDAFRESIPKMAQDALNSGSPGNTRRSPSLEDCMEIYQAAYVS